MSRILVRGLIASVAGSYLLLTPSRAEAADECVSDYWCHIEDCYNSAHYYCEILNPGCLILDASCGPGPCGGGSLYCEVQ